MAVREQVRNQIWNDPELDLHLGSLGPQERRVGLRSGRVAKWFAGQLITGERPLTRNSRRPQQRVRRDEGV